MNEVNITQLRSQKAEREVISAILADANIYTAVGHLLHEDLFSDQDCIKVYRIITQMSKENKTPDFVEVGMRLVQDGGDIAQFTYDGVPSYTLTKQRIELLQDLRIKRSMYQLGAKCMQLATDATSTISDFQKIVSDFSATAQTEESSIISFGDVLTHLTNDVADRMNGKLEVGLPTGLHMLDIRFGFHPGDLVIIAGETSQGKSTLATTIARNMASQNIPIAYYSLEMSSQQLCARMMAKDSHITSSRLLYSPLTAEEYNRFYDGSLSMKKLPIYFDERSKTSFDKICTSIRAMVRKHQIKMVVIDYLQILVNGAKNENREAVLGDMARDLKRLAVEENICIVALSQLKRDPINHEPSISRLRGSGQLEEACDMILLIYRPSVYGIERWSNSAPTANTAKLIIGKGRNIGLGEEIISFNAELTYFEDLDNSNITTTQVLEKMPWDY